MATRRGFTLIELLVVISIIALLIGILLPALGAARRSARQMKSNTQLRGIQQSMVMFAQGNKTYYPRIRGGTRRFVSNNDAGIESAGVNVGGTQYAGDLIGHEIMLDADYFSGEYVISPSEDKRIWTTGAVDSSMTSYTMLQMRIQAGANAGLPQPDPRNDEWRNTLNGLAIVMTDRNVGSGPTTTISTIHTALNSGDYKGSMAWNDNHVRFVTSQFQRTKYGPSSPTTEQDNLFIGNDDVNGAASIDDGLMMYNNKSNNTP